MFTKTTNLNKNFMIEKWCVCTYPQACPAGIRYTNIITPCTDITHTLSQTVYQSLHLADHCHWALIGVTHCEHNQE